MTNTALLKTERELHVIDVLNLAATPRPSPQGVDAIAAELRATVPGFEASQRIVACSRAAAPTVAFAFPSDRQLWRSGTDGAVFALLDVLADERVAERFGRVTICSGDGAFADAAARLARDGVEVTVVSRSGCLSARLELAARHVLQLTSAAPLASTGSAS